MTEIELLTKGRVAMALGVSLRKVDLLIATGALKAIHLGRLVRIEPAAVRRFIRASKAA